MQESTKKMISTLPAELQNLSYEDLEIIKVFIDGIIAGRATAGTNPVDAVQVPAKPRKRSACSICHQAGHRAPTCPAREIARVAS